MLNVQMNTLFFFIDLSQMEVVPLKEDGKEITESDDIFIENPSNLVCHRVCTSLSLVFFKVFDFFRGRSSCHSEVNFRRHLLMTF